MKALIAAVAMTVGVTAPAAAADWDGDYYGHEHYGAVAVAPVAPVVVAPVEPVVVAPVARVYMPPPPVYVAPVARVYAAPYYNRRYVGYGGAGATADGITVDGGVVDGRAIAGNAGRLAITRAKYRLEPRCWRTSVAGCGHD